MKTDTEIDKLVGQRVDIAPSAYQYRADRKPEENPPESWLALMQFAGLKFTKPVDPNSPAIQKVLCGFLWEEIRPVRTLELSWTAGTGNQPSPDELAITTLDNRGTASSWWNNLVPARERVEPILSSDGLTYFYKLPSPTCGIVIHIDGAKHAADYAVPAVRVLMAGAVWKKMDVEIEWGFDAAASGKDYSGRIETYDGMAANLHPLDGDAGTIATDGSSWNSKEKTTDRRGVKFSLLYMGSSKWREKQAYTTQQEDVARSIVTLWTQAGNFSFLAADLENGPIFAPEYGFFVRKTSVSASSLLPVKSPLAPVQQVACAKDFIRELQARNLSTIRKRIQTHEEQTWEGAVTPMCGEGLPSHPKPPIGSEPAMQVEVPSERLTAQWNLGAWHLVRHCEKNPVNGHLWFNDHPYGILAAETYLVLATLDLMGSHKAAEDGFDQWTSLPMQPRILQGKGRPWDERTYCQHAGSLPDRPVGNFSDGLGCLTLAEGAPGIGGHMDSVHAFGPGSIGWALTEHYWMSHDKEWLKAVAPRIKANAEWMLRQRRLTASLVPGGERLWCKGLQPALQVTPDSGGLWMNFYECEAYYWASVSRFAATLAEIDPTGGAQLAAEAEAYGNDLRAAVERSIALSPVVPVRDGTYHSVIPFACYVRGLATSAWGWRREGTAEHTGPIYWETVQSAAALVSPAGLLPVDDVRVQGYLDVLEDRLLLENINLRKRTPDFNPDLHWFAHAGWQYQGGLERTANLHLAGDDVPSFLRSFLNCYAIDILPYDGYTFNEHATRGPADKIFEEAAFLERFRNLLVMEEGENLWLARATPRAWLEQGKKISVKNAPTHFGEVDYEIVSDINNGKISVTVKIPSHKTVSEVRLRLRHPASTPIRSVMVNGKKWNDVDAAKEVVRLTGITGIVKVEVNY